MAKYQIDNMPAPIDFQGTDIIKRTLQNAKNLLMCRMWEVPYDRLRGLDQSLFDLPINQMNAELMPELDTLFLYEPDIKPVSAEASLLPNGEVLIKAIVDVTIKE